LAELILGKLPISLLQAAMAIMDSGQDQELAQMNHLWSIISELSEQLSQNRSLAVSLYGQADAVNASFEILSELVIVFLKCWAFNRVRQFMAKLDLCSEGMTLLVSSSRDHILI
jgi:translation initiation factor 2B subunit (eIF-2B alpha/beta/delta family)